MSGANASQKHLLSDVLQACNFIKKRLQHRCFAMKFTKSLRTPFFLQNTSTLMTASGSKHCKPMKTYTEIFILLRKKWCTWTVLLRLVFLDNEYSSEFFQTFLAVPHFSNIAWKSQKQLSRDSVKKVFLKILQTKGVFL